MQKKYFTLTLLLNTILVFSQSNNNGKLDKIEEFTSFTTIPFTMNDGTKLMTDVYLPITSDSLTTNVSISGNTYNVQIIPKGTQLFVYDSINGTENQNPYQLPMVFTRTPYGKGSYDKFGVLMNILGYSYALQDMRGRYTSEGVYIPMYSDAWKKEAYHPTVSHVLDITPINSNKNSIYHEDGKNSIEFILDSLYKDYDLDNDGIAETNDKIYNGSLAMFGASALGNTQYQAASTFRNNTSNDGLKGLLPIVATLEYYNSTIQNNGVFRRALTRGWLERQMIDVVDTIPSDTSINNSIHSIFDYGNISGDSIMGLAVDQFSVIQDPNGYSAMYPNYMYRSDMDASFAKINNLGESDINGTHSRYENLSLPIYHLTGWWDIFIDGQIETYKNIMENNSNDIKSNQKLVIGPWTHPTIGKDSVADIVYPNSVFDLKIVENLNSTNANNLNSVIDGEVVSWLRYLLNYEPGKEIGEPKVLIPESNEWQNLGTYDVRVPSQNYYVEYSDFLNYLSGHQGLQSMPTEIRQGTNIIPYSLDIPADTTNQTPGQSALSNPATPIIDYSTVPNIRYYIPGPVNDGIVENVNVGNYWESSDVFPLTNGIENRTYYLHSNGVVDTLKPNYTETPLTYSHDPDNPVFTVGGGNLAVPTPQLDRVSAGPMNYADTNFASFTMNRPDVLQFETDFIEDSLTIVGIPKAKIYAKTTPNGVSNGLTDTDFFVRIIDVYPDGREYFVVEGAINARARNYVKTLVNNNEDINIPFSNINIGEVYEYEFNLLPIAYSFGHQHKMKILISSSNWPRYQSNPNLPIENGTFFRREPNDGKTYTFNNIIMSPRIAEQEINFSDSKPSQIVLPVRSNNYVSDNITKKDINSYKLYPNPTSNVVYISCNNNIENYSYTIQNMTNQIVKKEQNLIGNNFVNLKNLPSGIYLFTIINNNGFKSVNKIVKQ